MNIRTTTKANIGFLSLSLSVGPQFFSCASALLSDSLECYASACVCACVNLSSATREARPPQNQAASHRWRARIDGNITATREEKSARMIDCASMIITGAQLGIPSRRRRRSSGSGRRAILCNSTPPIEEALLIVWRGQWRALVGRRPLSAAAVVVTGRTRIWAPPRDQRVDTKRNERHASQWICAQETSQSIIALAQPKNLAQPSAAE